MARPRPPPAQPQQPAQQQVQAPAPTAAPEDEEEREPTTTIKFKETLTWRPGQRIETDTLMKRLQTLSKELAAIEQGDVDKDSLVPYAKQLASSGLLTHKEKGVKAWTACCLVDVLRLCAPDAPYTASQLKDVFALLIKDIIPALFDPSSPYNTQHAYVLQSLAEVKSIALALDLSSAEQLLQYLFSSIFDGISGKSKGGTGDRIAKDVELNMTEILKTAIEETDVLPTKVVDIIMAQFLRAAAGKEKAGTAAIGPNQTTLAIKEEPRAYGMAKTLCNSCPDKMARQVSQYFSDVILEASGVANRSNGHKSKDDDDGAGGPSEDDLKDLRKAHQLLRELWRAAPALLQNVIPQIELELVADHVDVRLLATETLGDMIAGIGAAGPPPPPLLDPTAYPPVKLMDAAASASSTPSSILTTPISPQSFAQTHSTAYQGFVSRRNDKNASIRAAWTIAAGYIVSTSAGGIGLGREDEADLIRSLGDKLNDTDEKVRLAAVKAIESFSFRDIVEKLGAEGGLDKPGSILSSLADRSRDRKPAVRIEGMALLAKLWAVGAGEMAAGQEAVVAALSGIPSRIIGGFYANDKEYNLLMDRVMFECLIPLGFPAQKQKTTANGKAASISSFDQDNIRAARVLLFTHMLDAHSKKAFFAMQARQPQYAAVMLKFLDLCDAYNGGVASKKDGEQVKRLDQTVTYLSQFFPDGERTRADLLKFAKLNDRRNYQLIRYAVAPEYDFKTVYRAIKELSKRLKDGAHASLLETLIPLLYRSSCLLFNKSHFQTFIEHAKNDRDGLGATAHEILNEISQRNPDIFKTHVGELCKGLTASPPTADKQNDAADVETLRAIATYSRRSADDLPQDRRFVQTLIAYGLYGQPAKASKYAVNIILSRKDEEGMKAATDLLNRTMVDFTYGSKNFLNKLYTIGQLELLAPTVTRHVDDAILDMALKQILSTNRQDAGDEPEDAWVEDADLDEECQAKCLALKILVNRLRSEEDVDEARTHTAPTLKLLRQLIDKRGEFVKSKPTPPHIRSRLLLLAAQLTLKLCMKKHFDELLTPVDFDRLALVTQDAVPQVRKRFVERLQKYLAAKRLPLRFYAIVFLTAYEPDPASKAQTETWIRSRARDFAAQAQASGGAATNVMEAMITRLISLLAHHPDFGLDEEDLLPHARYIVYYLANVATEQNLGVIVKFVERVKQTQDAVYPDKSDRIYAVCDLAMAVIRRWQARKNWALSVYPGKVGLPVGLYAKLSSHQEAQDIAEKQYIPEGIEDQLDDMLRSSEKKKKRKSTDEGQQPSKKLKVPPKASQAPKQERDKASVAKKPKTAAKTSKAAQKGRKTARGSDSEDSDVDERPPRGAARLAESTRRSSRTRSGAGQRNYVERDSEDDDEEMLEGVAEWEYASDGADRSEDEEPQKEAESSPKGRRSSRRRKVASPEPMDEDEDGEPETMQEGGEEDDQVAEQQEDTEEKAAADEDSDEAVRPQKVTKVAVAARKIAKPTSRAAAAATVLKQSKLPSREKAAPAKTSSSASASASAKSALASTKKASGGRGKKVKDPYDFDG